MDFQLTDEQELLLNSLRDLINRDFSEEYFRQHDDEHKVPHEFLAALGDNGFTMIGVPDELGGTPADMVTQLLVIIELGRLGAPSYWLGAHHIHNMLEFGTQKQLELTLESVKKGIIGYSLGITEPGAGSDTSAIQTTYTRKNGKVYINGQKTFTTGALDYPYMLVAARNPEASDPKKAFTLWWVDPNKAKGVTRNRLHKIGWRTVSNCEVYFDNVEVEESDMVGEEGKGFLHLMKNFEIERLAVSAYTLGPAICAFEDAARYANQRVQFGKTIGSFQLIQEKLVFMETKIENMRNMILKGGWMADNNMSLRKYAALCKLYCTVSAQEVCDDAMQVMGGIGYVDDTRVSRFWRDSRLNRLGGGTDEIMKHIAGREILKEYK